MQKEWDRDTKKESKIYYKWLKKLPAKTVVKFKAREGEDRTITVRKKIKAFKKPKVPVRKDFVYGPEIHLAGFDIDGERVLLEGTAGNFLAFTVGNLVGSCPYLYAWSDKLQQWRNYGKVIHTAQGRQRETTERVKLNGFSTRFRLTEEELELSEINQVRLIVKLKTGQEHILLPEKQSVRGNDRHYERIYAGATFEFSFKVPEGVARKDVASSFLEVTGYYRRYGATYESAGASN